MKHLIYIFALLVICSCNNDISLPDAVEINISVSYPDDVDNSTISAGEVVFHNVSTGADTHHAVTGSITTVNLLPGLYDISYTASATLLSGGEATLRASQTTAALTESCNIALNAYALANANDLIIKEIFFTGTLQTSGNQYNGDQYFKLVNNTDHTVYADGIVIFESLFLTTQKLDYTPDVMDKAVSVDALYAIPGNGTEYPLEPGEEMLIADIAIDHRTINPNSFDLSHADFEWYDQSTVPSTVDIDNPLVPNLDKWYCYTKSIWQLHNRGFKAYGLARVPVDKEQYMSEHYYSCDYELVTVAGVFPMSKSGYTMPNEWIVDVVNLSVSSGFQWCVTAPALDSSWAFCGTQSNDKTRYFRAVRRRAVATENGRVVFADTNNSAADFNSCVLPSEIELQGTSTAADGQPATTITIDGIKPI